MSSYIQFLIRRGTEAEWAVANPVLGLGEFGLATDTRELKLGDGVTAWNVLVPDVGAGGSGTITASLPIVSLTAAGGTTPLDVTGTKTITSIYSVSNINTSVTVRMEGRMDSGPWVNLDPLAVDTVITADGVYGFTVSAVAVDECRFLWVSEEGGTTAGIAVGILAVSGSDPVETRGPQITITAGSPSATLAAVNRQPVLLQNNATLTLPDPDFSLGLQVEALQDGDGNRTITWAVPVGYTLYWTDSNIAPVPSLGADKLTYFYFEINPLTNIAVGQRVFFQL